MEQEKDLQSQNAWLNAELKTKSEELLSLSREKGNEILELKCGLASREEEVARLQDIVTSMKASNENLQRQTEDLINKLKEVKEQQGSKEEKLLYELNANIKLSNLYKAAAEDFESKSNVLTLAVEKILKLLKETEEAKKTVEERLMELKKSKDKTEVELTDKIRNLEKELDNANELLSDSKRRGIDVLTEEQLSTMSPTAAAVAKIVKPGMKLTELDSAYVEAQDQLQMERMENKRVNKHLDEIVQEVEAKAPLLKRQRDEFERMQKSVASLSTKLEQAMREVCRLQNESDEANQRASVLERDNQRFELQLGDLSRQVRILLIELEEARGNHVIRDEEDLSSADVIRSSEVISQHLVTFRNVEELQQQNQRLLVVLRDLAEAQEKEEMEGDSSRRTELEQSLDKMQSDLEQLREQRHRHMQITESIVRQRDMYRILLAQTTGVSFPAQGVTPDEWSLTSTRCCAPAVTPTTATPVQVTAAESTEAAEAKAALKQLQEVFTMYKKEKAENVKILNEQNEKLQEQASALRSQNTKISTQLGFASKQNEMLQDSVEGYRREIAALLEKGQKTSATAQKQAGIIHTMTQDLRAANERLAMAEALGGREAEARSLLQLELSRLKQELQEKSAAEEQQRLVMEEKIKKVILGARQKISLVMGQKEQVLKENEELKQQRELEVRMGALKSQYEGRICRLDRELRDLQEQQERHSEKRDEPPEQGPSKVQEQQRSTSPNSQAILSQPILTMQQQTQAVKEGVPSSQKDRPSTDFDTATPRTSTDRVATQEESYEPPIAKKLRIIQRGGPRGVRFSRPSLKKGDHK